MFSPDPEQSKPAVPAGPVAVPSVQSEPCGLAECFSDLACSEVLVDSLSECRPGDSVSQAGAPVEPDNEIFCNCHPYADYDTQSESGDNQDSGSIGASMLASIRNIELNIERLYMHIDRVHTDQARSQRAHGPFRPTAPARSHGAEGTRVPEKHRGRGRGNARHSQRRTPESYGYAH